MQNKNNLLWVDLEMTGLDPSKHHIIEASIVATNSELQPLHKGIDIVIHQDDELLSDMDAWCQEYHAKSGLIEQVKKSVVSLREAEVQMLEIATAYCIPGMALLAGNSIHQDRIFTKTHMPEFEKYLTYRIVDSSSIKELVVRWYPQLPVFSKKGHHRALDDIYESIAELKYYRNIVFKTPADLK